MYLASWALITFGERRRHFELAVIAASQVQRVDRPIGVEVGSVGTLKAIQLVVIEKLLRQLN